MIATADYVVALFGGSLLMRAAAEAPQLSFDFVEMRPQFINRTTRPDIDLFVFPANALRTTGMEQVPLYRDSYVCIGAADNAALYENMPVDDFLSLRHIGYSALPRVAFNHEMMLWDDLGKDTNLRLTMGNYLIFARIVAASDAVAILPKRLATIADRRMEAQMDRAAAATPETEITAMWRPDQGKDIALAWLGRRWWILRRSMRLGRRIRPGNPPEYRPAGQPSPAG